MAASILTSVIAYISTNIDDIFVLMILLAQTPKGARHKPAAGHFLGVSIITLISLLGAFGLQRLPLKYVGLLGLVPIALGIRAWATRRKGGDGGQDAQGVDILSMAMITLGNGADNVGVYIPLFTGFSVAEQIAAAAVFAAMTAVWLLLADSLAESPRIKAIIGKYSHILIPVVFIGLGIYIILDSGLLG